MNSGTLTLHCPICSHPLELTEKLVPNDMIKEWDSLQEDVVALNTKISNVKCARCQQEIKIPWSAIPFQIIKNIRNFDQKKSPKKRKKGERDIGLTLEKEVGKLMRKVKKDHKKLIEYEEIPSYVSSEEDFDKMMEALSDNPKREIIWQEITSLLSLQSEAKKLVFSDSLKELVCEEVAKQIDSHTQVLYVLEKEMGVHDNE